MIIQELYLFKRINVFVCCSQSNTGDMSILYIPSLYNYNNNILQRCWRLKYYIIKVISIPAAYKPKTNKKKIFHNLYYNK